MLTSAANAALATTGLVQYLLTDHQPPTVPAAHGKTAPKPHAATKLSTPAAAGNKAPTSKTTATTSISAGATTSTSLPSTTPSTSKTAGIQDAAGTTGGVGSNASSGAVVDNSTLVFTNAKATGNPPSAPRLVTLTNTNATSINFTSAVITGDTTDFAISSQPAANAVIAPGGMVTVGVTFTAPSSTSTVTLHTATLTINTTDTINPAIAVNLRAFALTGYQGGPEPSLGQILDTLYQLPINVANPPSTLNTLDLPYQLNGTMTVPYGDEVVAQTFVKASSAPVTVEPLVTFGPASTPPGGTDYTWGVYTPGNAASTSPVYSATTPVGSPSGGDAQTANPIAHPVAGDTVSTDGNNIVSFDPGNSDFGVYTFFPVETPNLTAYSQDSLNNSIPINGIAHQTRRIRFWPDKTTAGVVIPNSYVGAIEEANNNDIQDVVFVINNVTVVDLPQQLAFTQQPVSTLPGATISPAVTVAIEDSTGAVLTGDSSTVTLALSHGTFADGNTSETATASSGIATFNNLVINATGNYTLTASDSSLATAVSGNFTISASAAKLAITAQPVNAVAGAAFSDPITVAVEDALGNTISTDTSTVTLTLSSGTFFGGGMTATAVASGGVATFTNLVPNSSDTAGNYTLAATDSSLTGATSNSFSLKSSSGITNIDDNNTNNVSPVPKVVYGHVGGGNGSWSQASTTILNAFGGTVTNSLATNDTATVTFTGTQITFYAGEKTNRGFAGISIDGGSETQVDLYSTANNGNGTSLPVYTSPILSAGSHAIQVRVTGTKDPTGNGTTVSIDRFVVSDATPAITWSNPAAITYGTALSGTQLNAGVTAAANNGLTLGGTYVYSPVAGTILSAGQQQSLKVTFTPSDGADYNTANATVQINVNPANSTTTLTAAAGSPSPSAIGQGATFTATVSSSAPGTPTPSGSVQFQVDGTNVGTPVTLSGGSATSAAISNMTAGTHSITAVYSSDNGNFATSTSNTFSQTVLPGWLTATTGASIVWTPAGSPQTLQISSGTATIIADPGETQFNSGAGDSPVITVTGSGTKLVIAPTDGSLMVHIGGLTVQSSATADVSSLGAARTHSNHRVLVIGKVNQTAAPVFNIDNTNGSVSKLNLEDNDMIVHGGSSTNDLAAVQAAAATGRNVAPGGIFNGTWTGNGLTSSTAAAVDAAAHNEQNILAVELNSDRFLGKLSAWTVGPASAPVSEPLRADGNDVIVKYTYNGDLNLSGAVDDNAVTILGNFYADGKSLTSQGFKNDYAYGDLNGDGFVDDNDVTILGNFYGAGTVGNALPPL
jgi:methionine-rich copper-binding protein CopC/uncharacterized membrane protein